MIPEYRAKKIDSDEYIKGFLVKQGREHFISLGIWSKEESKNFHHFDLYKLELIKIDPTTLSIHFPDMIDSQGNKIFASLQEDGKGGDILDCRIAVNCDKPTRLMPIKYTKPYRFTIGVYDIDVYVRKYIVGIKE